MDVLADLNNFSAAIIQKNEKERTELVQTGEQVIEQLVHQQMPRLDVVDRA